MTRIESETEFREALAEASAYFARLPKPGTPEEDAFEALCELLTAYENLSYSVSAER